jgi:hypothetical protein
LVSGCCSTSRMETSVGRPRWIGRLPRPERLANDANEGRNPWNEGIYIPAVSWIAPHFSRVHLPLLATRGRLDARVGGIPSCRISCWPSLPYTSRSLPLVREEGGGQRDGLLGVATSDDNASTVDIEHRVASPRPSYDTIPVVATPTIVDCPVKGLIPTECIFEKWPEPLRARLLVRSETGSLFAYTLAIAKNNHHPKKSLTTR